MNSPFARFFLSISDRIEKEVPQIQYIDNDLGQLQGYSQRPSVAFPCILIDFQNWQFENLGSNVQTAQGEVIIRLGFAQFDDTSNLSNEQWREDALDYLDIEWALNKALHAFAPGDDSGVLTRISATGENRPMGIRVRTIRYLLEFEDYSSCNPEPTIKVPTNVKISN